MHTEHNAKFSYNSLKCFKVKTQNLPHCAVCQSILCLFFNDVPHITSFVELFNWKYVYACTLVHILIMYVCTQKRKCMQGRAFTEYSTIRLSKCYSTLSISIWLIVNIYFWGFGDFFSTADIDCVLWCW